MYDRVAHELKHHIPFTLFGALTGVIAVFFTQNISHETAHTLFYIFHPFHVVLSALVTASMYKLYKCGKLGNKCNIWVLLVIGYTGSIGIATLSDSVMPYLAEVLLDLPNRNPHIGFIEEWWLVNPAALVGVVIAYFWPETEFPHAGHVLLSTWASLFHIIMALGGLISVMTAVGVFIFLFLSVWLPCCFSDIIFPLFFVGKENNSCKKCD